MYKHITSEKIATCHALDISFQTIRDWYASFVNIFNDSIMTKIHNDNLPQSELDRHLKEIADYIYGRRYPDIIEEQIRCLKRLQDPDGPSRSLNFFEDKILRKFHISEQTISMVKKLEANENEFLTLATNMKLDFRQHYILLKEPHHLSPLDISQVKDALLERRANIFELISDIKNNIGCESQTIRILYEGLNI